MYAEDVRQALYASKICSYAQGFQLLSMASAEYGWRLDFGAIALMWRGGCIIRAAFLDRIKGAYDETPDLANLLLASYFRDAIAGAQSAWRRVVANAVMRGVPVPAFSSALAWYDGYRSERLPANLLQAQRDYFGAHTYERDRPPARRVLPYRLDGARGRHGLDLVQRLAGLCVGPTRHVPPQGYQVATSSPRGIFFSAS